MPKRKPSINPGQFYHIYNRSIASEQIFSGFYSNEFLTRMDFFRLKGFIKYDEFLSSKLESQKEIMSRIREKPQIEIVSFAIMPTHFHILALELDGGGIQNTLRRIQMSYALFYNQSKRRHGPVFCQRFKAKLITSPKHLIDVSRYIHLNPIKASLITFDELMKWRFTSMSWYCGRYKSDMVKSEHVLKYFSDLEEYKKFLLTPGAPDPE